MEQNVLSVIASMAQTTTLEPVDHTIRNPRQPVIALSRDFGAEGDLIATMLAERLKVPLYDEELLRQVADRLKDDAAIIKMMDESIGRAKDMWLYRLFSGKDISPNNYRDALVRVVMSLGRLGGVIVGRGAHVILADACALRVRISGTPEICARRLAAKGEGDYSGLLERIRQINHARGEFVWTVFHSRLADASQFDVVVNTDRLSDVDDIVSMLVDLSSAIHAGRVLLPAEV